jgi:hypothetical protein
MEKIAAKRLSFLTIKCKNIIFVMEADRGNPEITII